MVDLKCGSCAFGKKRKYSSKKSRPSRKFGRRKSSGSKRKHRRHKKRSFGRRKHRKSSKRSIGRKKRSFGKISSSLDFMGNYSPGNGMSTFQQYTGMPPAQMQKHLDAVPKNLRDTFYANTV
jgi:hypothetical protein